MGTFDHLLSSCMETLLQMVLCKVQPGLWIMGKIWLSVLGKKLLIFGEC